MNIAINAVTSPVHTGSDPRERSLKWSVAVGLIGLFGVIGWIVGRLAVVFQGFPLNLVPLPQRLLFGYGQLAIPLFGVVAAAAWVLSDIYFRGRWVQWFLFALFACAIVVIFVVMVAPIFVMGDYTAPR